MTLIILDPNLDRETGHHIEWDLAIARSAMDRGEAVVIYTNNRCEIRERFGVTFVPWFSHTCYEIRHTDPISGQFDDFGYFNDRMFEELLRLPRDLFRSGDAVLVPTLTEKHLLGYVAWMKTFDPARAPTFIVHLMFPSGLYCSKDGEVEIKDSFQALFYQLAFREAKKPGPKINFYGGGRQLARQFTALLGTTVEPHPIPNCPIRENPFVGCDELACLLFAGDAKSDKGFLLVPELIQRLCTEYPNWKFLVHANGDAAWGSAQDAYRFMLEIAPRFPNLQLVTGRLARSDYLSLMMSSCAMISTYDPIVYERKSSGVLWEAISLSIPVLVPKDTWLEREAQDWGAGYVTYSEHTVQGICEGFVTFSSQIAELATLSEGAAARYQALNGENELMNQIGHLWMSRLAAARLVTQPDEQTLSLEEVSGEGWSYVEHLDGKPVRWIGKECQIDFSWPHVTAWSLDITVLNCIAEEQIEKAKAFLAGQEIDCTSKLESTKSGSISILGKGLGRQAPHVQIRLVLPWVYRPESETRDLGLLVGAIRLSPASADASGRETPTACVVTPVTKSPEGDAFLFKKVVSGVAVLDPRSNALIQFEVRMTGGVETVRALRFFLNGLPVILNAQFVTDGVWSVSGECSSNIVSIGGYRSDWDITVIEAVDNEVWIANMLLGGSPVVVQGYEPLGESNSDIDHVVSVEGPVIDEPKDEPNKVSAALDNTSSLQIVGQAGAFLADAEDSWLDEYYVNGSYCHIDLTIAGITCGGQHWPRFKFKVCSDNGATYLEFRSLEGWPEMFIRWPGEEHDAFGDCLKIGEISPQLDTEKLVIQDRFMLQCLAAILPAAVFTALSRSGEQISSAEMWTEKARYISTYLTENVLQFA